MNKYNFNLTKKTAERLKKYPVLSFCVNNFIENDGTNPAPRRLTPLTVYIRNLFVFEPDLFDWDDEICEDFCSWGHNSRYANVLEPMLIVSLDIHISHILDYLEDFNITEPQTIEYYEAILQPDTLPN